MIEQEKIQIDVTKASIREVASFMGVVIKSIAEAPGDHERDLACKALGSIIFVLVLTERVGFAISEPNSPDKKELKIELH